MSSMVWKICYFYKIAASKSLRFLTKLVHINNAVYDTRNNSNISLMNSKKIFLKNSFFPSASRCNPLNSVYSNWVILKFETCQVTIYSEYSTFFNMTVLKVQYLTRLWLNFGHLCNHEFKHSFQDILNPLCTCNIDEETISRFILHCLYWVILKFETCQVTIYSEYSTFFNMTVLKVQYLTRLWLNFGHLCNHEFKHSFQDTLNPLCTCNLDEETISHFILHCLYYKNECQTILYT